MIPMMCNVEAPLRVLRIEFFAEMGMNLQRKKMDFVS
jgi:hypothetical protein